MAHPEVERVKQELRDKNLALIHYETALAWLVRAIAAHALFLETRESHWLLDAAEYAQEALEHAALTRDPGATVLYVSSELIPLRRTLKDDRA